MKEVILLIVLLLFSKAIIIKSIMISVRSFKVMNNPANYHLKPTNSDIIYYFIQSIITCIGWGCFYYLTHK